MQVGSQNIRPALVLHCPTGATNQPKGCENQKPSHKAPPPAFTPSAPPTQLAGLAPHSYLPFCFLLLLPQPTGHQVTVAHAVFTCGHRTASVLPSPVARFATARISHYFILHATISRPHHAPAYKAVTVPYCAISQSPQQRT